MNPLEQAGYERLRAAKDAAYLERNRCVALIARMALAMGLRAWVTRTAIEGWSEDWHGCVYVELPTGQCSWHFHDSQEPLFAGIPQLPPGEVPWDGHTTEVKYERVGAAFPPGSGSLRHALEEIAAMAPCMDGGGGCFYPVVDGEGEYRGEQTVDPLSVIAGMVTKANDALSNVN